MFTINMFPNGQIQLVDQRSLASQTRYVSLESLIEVFRQQAIGSPVLPPGCLQYWRGHEYSIFVLQKPAHVREMWLGTVSYAMPVPDLLFVFRIRQDPANPLSLADSVVLAMTGPWENEDTVLYEFPYGNIFSDRTVCWGDFEVEVPNFHHLDVLTDIFLSTPFNTDLSGNYQNPNPEEQNLEEFWQALHGLPTFPTDRLCRAFLYHELTEQLADTIFF